MDNLNVYRIKGNFISRIYHKPTFLKNIITRNLAYFLYTLFVYILLFFHSIVRKKSQEYKYKVSICGIFKNEAKFLDEWIKFHLVIGIDHFYMYNNNSEDNFLEVLKPYIDCGIVDLIDWPLESSQMQAYQDCYNRFRSETHWLSFIDIDEFICPISENNIKDWLEPYNSYPSIAVYWKQFGSDGKLKHDYNKLVIEQYTQCWPKFSVLTKMFCNMDFEISEFENPHILSSNILGFKVKPINQFARLINYGVHSSFLAKKDKIQINHYWNKAQDIFEEKLNRTDVHFSDSAERAKIKKNLLTSHELMCTQKDFTIQKYTLLTKIKSIV